MSSVSISTHACTVLLYIVYFRNISLSYLCLFHGGNVSEALRECCIEGVWTAASRSNSLMRPQWACVSINLTKTRGHHCNMAHSCWPNPIYYVLLACEIPKCRINHGILYWREWYCISERLTMVTVKHHSHPPVWKKLFERCHIPPQDPQNLSTWHIWRAKHHQDSNNQ